MEKFNLRHKDICINEDKPFANCKLNRKVDARRVNKIVENSEGGFTLAINGEWGVGKTTFIKMWEADLKSKKYKTIYLNAWEHDISSEPLICILGEICNLLKEKEDVKKELISKAKFFLKKALPIVIDRIASHYMGAELVEDIKNVISCDTNENFIDKEISDYVSRTSRLKDLRDALENTVTKISEHKPLIFIVDELDRCRPDFAVEILEKIKHLFSVKNVVFVLSIDKVQLGYSVQGHYGSDKINAQEYLRRFIDIEYSLNTPSVEHFVDYLYDYYDFDSFINGETRLIMNQPENDKIHLLEMAKSLAKMRQLTLRKIDKMFAHTRLALLTFGDNQNIIPDVFLFIVYLKLVAPDIYKKVKEKTYKLQELSEILNSLSEEFYINLNATNNVTCCFVKFLILYNNDLVNTERYCQFPSEKNELKNFFPFGPIEQVQNLIEFYGRDQFFIDNGLSCIIKHAEMT